MLDAGDRSAAAARPIRARSCSSSSRRTRRGRWSPQRAPRRLRRRAGADPRAPRSLGQREYYFNDAGWPDPAARRVGAGARARRGRFPRAATRAITCSSWRRSWRARTIRRSRSKRSRPARSRSCWSGSRRRSCATACAYDAFFSERTLHEGSPNGVERALSILEDGRPRLPLRRGGLAAHHQLRRRQGPGRDPLQRRADLPRGRHRLPAGEARARLRAPADAGRRPTTTPTCAS